MLGRRLGTSKTRSRAKLRSRFDECPVLVAGAIGVRPQEVSRAAEVGSLGVSGQEDRFDMRTAEGLTHSRIKAVRAGAKRQALCDGGSLYLIVARRTARAPYGATKYWEYRFRSPVTGRRSSLTLGTFPAMSIQDARRARDQKATLLARGLDPAHEKRRAKTLNTLTFEDAARAWDAARAGIVDDRTRSTAMARLTLHVFPELGTWPLMRIGPVDLRRVLDAIVAQGHPETAHRTSTVIHQVFEWAESREHVESNPQRSLRKAYPSREGKHFAAITNAEEFGSLLRAIDGYTGHVSTRAALRLLPLVFVRSSELRCAEWSEFDLDGATWTIPAARMKISGNGEHFVPLAPQAVAILRELHAVTGRKPRVFPGLRPGKTLSDNTLNAALTTLGFGPSVHRAHGFRTSASTMLNEMAARDAGRLFNFEHVEAQLGHRPKDRVRDAYMRATFLDQRRAMMKMWADECDRMRNQAALAVTADGAL